MIFLFVSNPRIWPDLISFTLFPPIITSNSPLILLYHQFFAYTITNFEFSKSYIVLSIEKIEQKNHLPLPPVPHLIFRLIFISISADWFIINSLKLFINLISILFITSENRPFIVPSDRWSTHHRSTAGANCTFCVFSIFFIARLYFPVYQTTPNCISTVGRLICSDRFCFTQVISSALLAS